MINGQQFSDDCYHTLVSYLRSLYHLQELQDETVIHEIKNCSCYCKESCISLLLTYISVSVCCFPPVHPTSFLLLSDSFGHSFCRIKSLSNTVFLEVTILDEDKIIN